MLPLLPIFLVGLPPMLLLGFLGFAGLVILGVLLICVGLSGGLDANNAFNEKSSSTAMRAARNAPSRPRTCIRRSVSAPLMTRPEPG